MYILEHCAKAKELSVDFSDSFDFSVFPQTEVDPFVYETDNFVNELWDSREQCLGEIPVLQAPVEKYVIRLDGKIIDTNNNSAKYLKS